MIDYMLKYTNASRAFYIGHSQGTTSLLVLLSTRPEYNEKIIQGHLFAPPAFMKHFPNTFVRMIANEFNGLGNQKGALDFSNPMIKDMVHNIAKTLCHESSPVLQMCESTIQIMCGYNKFEVETDPKVLENIFSHVSHAASLKQPEHYFQLISSGLFRQFDYFEGNMKIYNSSTPPEYNLNNIRMPTYIYSGSCDYLVSEFDIDHLREVLPNVQKHKNLENYNHCDFNYGKNSKRLLFDGVLMDIESSK